MSAPLVIYTVQQLAELLRCAPSTVEEWARQGKLAGLKPGGEWIFPAGALAQGLDLLATEEAAARRSTKPQPVATVQTPAPAPRRGPRSRVLPRLVDMREA